MAFRTQIRSYGGFNQTTATWVSVLRRHMPSLSLQWSCKSNIYLVSIKTEFGNAVGLTGLPLPHAMTTSTRGKMRQQFFLCKHFMQSRWTSRKLWRTWGALRVWLFCWSKAHSRNKINMKRTAVIIVKIPWMIFDWIPYSAYNLGTSKIIKYRAREFHQII